MLHGCKWFLAVYVDFICILICQYLCVYVFMSSSGTCDWEFVFDLRLHFGIILGAVVSIGASWAQIGFTLGTIVIHYSFGGHLWCSGLTLWEIWTSREASSRVAPHLTEVRIQLKRLGFWPFICSLSNQTAVRDLDALVATNLKAATSAADLQNSRNTYKLMIFQKTQFGGYLGPF